MVALALCVVLSTSALSQGINVSSVGQSRALGQLLLSIAPGTPRLDNGIENTVREMPRTISARLAQMPSRYSTELATPMVSLKPRDVVENSLIALSQNKMHTWLKFLDPNARRLRAHWATDSEYSVINQCSSFKIKSELRISPDRYMFIVEATKAFATGFFGMNGGRTSSEYSITLSRSACFEKGQTVMHALDYQIGMIIGKDPFCKMDDDWIKEHNIDALPRGRDQPFYMILPDSRSEGGTGIRYAAEDVLLKADLEHSYHNPLVNVFLKTEEEKEPQDEANGELAPEGEGCWLVHDIRRWR